MNLKVQRFIVLFKANLMREVYSFLTGQEEVVWSIVSPLKKILSMS